MGKFAVLAFLGLAAIVLKAQPAVTPPLQRVVEFPYPVRVVDYCSVPSIAIALAQKLKVPAGAEFLPGQCYPSGRPAELNVELDLLGQTFEHVLNRLVEADPRYRWLESDGVILIRPLASWSDSTNFLNHSIERFTLNDAHMGGALAVVVAFLRGQYSEEMALTPMRSEEGNQRITLQVGPTSIAGALSSIVAAHGNLVWEARGHSKTTLGEQDGSIYFLTSGLRDGIAATTKLRR